MPSAYHLAPHHPSALNRTEKKAACPGVPSPQHSTCTFSTVHGHRSGSRLRSKTPVEVGVVLKQPPVSIASTTDQVPEGAYVALAKSGGLAVDEGRAVPGVELLLARVWGWSPAVIVSDPYRTQELHQVVAGRTRITERARGGGESTSNVQSLRSLLLDTGSGVTEASRALLGAAFAQTSLVIDGAGITKVVKMRAKRSRDDAAAALLLAAGEQARRPAPVELRGAVISRTGEVTWL